MARGGGEFSGVRVVFIDTRADLPTIGFLGVVAALHNPTPLVAVVRPPSAQGWAWSRWRIGASQYGVRQR